jgi:fumarylacetoacetase
MTDSTHDASLRSWVEPANDPATDFPIQNLPFGAFSGSAGDTPRIGVAIGDRVLDITACAGVGLIGNSRAARACRLPTLNELMSVGSDETRALRSEISNLLRDDTDAGRAAAKLGSKILHAMADVVLRLPVAIGDYTDFYASVDHAANVGSMFRPDNPLLPNYKHVPIGYHGRASSIVVSGTPVRRPYGQTKSPDAPGPAFGPSKMLDYESELGFYVRRGNALGEMIPLKAARESIFGFTLVNDWSARDIQAWEYQPLGPFLSKNFATTVSPWVITAEAVEPYAIQALARPDGDPDPLPYLSSESERTAGGLNAFLEVYLMSGEMRDRGMNPMRLSRAAFSGMYWTVGQMLAHHASNGCNLKAGDLLASGTVSGPDRDSRGCLLELTWRGAEPLALPTGEERRFLQDGDEVIMKGSLEMRGRPRIGFGECRGVILPAAV